MNFLYLDFINSLEKDYLSGEPQEHLTEPDWLANLLSSYDLAMPTPTLTQPVLENLTQFRTIMRRVAENIVAGQELETEDLEQLNRYLDKAKLSRRLVKAKDAYQLKLIPLKQNWDWIEAEIVSSLIDFLDNADPQRLKICDNDKCLWLFYDESKSRTRRYCSDKSCGNLLKVRRFRERQKSAADLTDAAGHNHG